MKTKQAFWSAALVYFLVPALFIAFNFSVDPFGRYHPLASNTMLEKLAASKNEVLVTEYNYNDRLLTKNFISAVPRPGLVLFGGSRILNIDGDAFKPEAGRVFNAGVTAASIRDHIAIWQELKNKNKIPHRAIVFIDLQSFYSNSSAIGWWTLSCPFLTFEYGRMKLPKYLKLVSKTYRKKSKFHLESLSSSDLLKKSWERVSGERKTRSRLIERSMLEPKNAARTPSLALIAPAPSEEEKQQSVIDQWAAENGQGESSILRDWSNFNDDAFKEFASLLEDMRESKVEVSVIIMPSHPGSYRLVEKDPAALVNLGRFTKRVQELCGEYGVKYYDGLYEHHQDVANTDFKDGVHLKKEAAYAFLTRSAQSIKISYAKQSF